MTTGPRRRADLVVLVEDWPWPPRSGMHHRSLALLDAADQLGLSVAVASVAPRRNVDALTTHDPEVPAAMYGGHWADLSAERGRYWFERLARHKCSFSAPGMAPFGARAWLDDLVTAHRARATVVSLARNAWIGGRRPRDRTVRILDLVDLLSINQVLWQKIDPQLGRRPVIPSEVAPEILSDNYALEHRTQPDPRELAVVAHFDLTLAVSEEETKVLAANCPQARVRWTPHVPSLASIENSYGPSAIMVMDNNPFNLQGYAWLATKVLPEVLTHIPEFKLSLAGRGSIQVRPVPGVQLLGEVDDLHPLYAKARMTLCPILAGTGQPTKIAESWAHGVPVVATRYAGSRCELRDGKDGFIATDATTFAARVVELWRAPQIARSMGDAGRGRIRTDAGTNALSLALDEALQTRLGRR